MISIDFKNRKTIKITAALAITFVFAVIFAGTDLNEPLIIFGLATINPISFMIFVIFGCVIILVVCMIFWNR